MDSFQVVLFNIIDISNKVNVEDKIKIEKIKTDESNDVFNLLKISFFKDEPLSAGNIPSKKDDVFAIKGLHQGFSLKAVDYQGNLIGVCINMDLSKLQKDSTKPSTERLKKIFALMDYLDKRITKVPGLLDLHIVAVSPEWRGKGIAKLLCEETEVLAKENGFSGINILCTGAYSAKMAESRGFICIYSLNYDDYLDENGKPIFETKLPHTTVRIYNKLFGNNYSY